MNYTSYRRGIMWQPITREEAAAPRPAEPPTEQDNIRAALAYIRRHYVPRYTDYPEEDDGQVPQTPR